MSGHGRLLNENRRLIAPFLDSVKRLRRAYDRGSLAEMEESARVMLAILAQAECQAAIDRELQARRLVPAKLEKEGLIADEVKLAESFGYSPREVKRYLRRARNVISAGVTVDIPTAADLAEHFEAIHGSAVDEIESDDGGWIKRRRRDRKARREAQDALFAVGTLVADIAARALFDLSYALAVMTLSEV